MRRLIVIAIVIGTVAILGAVALITTQRGEGQEDSLLDERNRRFEKLGLPTSESLELPTLPPELVPDAPVDTPGPSPTPYMPDCALGTIRGADNIIPKYGGATSNCGVVGRYVYFTTAGTTDEPGGIAIFRCDSKDPCKVSGPFDFDGAWEFYPAPRKAPVKPLSYYPPEETLIIFNDGQICFDLRTFEYKLERPCITEPTVPPGPPWPVTPYVEPTPVDLGPPPLQ